MRPVSAALESLGRLGVALRRLDSWVERVSMRCLWWLRSRAWEERRAVSLAAMSKATGESSVDSSMDGEGEERSSEVDMVRLLLMLKK